MDNEKQNNSLFWAHEYVRGRNHKSEGSLMGGDGANLRKRDLVSRRRADKEFRTSIEKYRMLFRGAPLGILLLDTAGRFLECNEQLNSILKAPKEAHESGNLRVFLKDNRIRSAMATALRGKASRVEGEFTLALSNEHLVVKGELAPLLSPAGTIMGVMGFFEEVVDRASGHEMPHRTTDYHRVVAESMKDVVWVLDAETMHFRYVSPSVRTLRGYSPEEVMAAPLDNALVPEARDYHKARIRHRISDFLSGQESPDRFYINEVELPHKDGSRVWTEETTSYCRNQETGKIEIMGVTRDITERKRVDAELRASKERFLTLVDSMDDIVFMLDRKQRVAGLYGRWMKKAKVEQGAFLGKKGSSIFGSESSAIHDEASARALAGEVVTYDWASGRGRDWCCFQIVLSPIRDAGNNVSGIVGISRDITERKRMEVKLLQSEKKLRDITSSLGEGIIVYDGQGRVTFVNPEAERLLGWTKQDLNRRGLHATICNGPAEDRLASFEDCWLHTVMRIGESYASTDRVFTRKDGTVFPISVIASPIQGHENTIAMVTAFRDITDQKKIEHDRELLITELQEALTKVKTLSGLLPICSSCKKIRDDKGYWRQIEAYITDHSNAAFTHGFCPDCAKAFYERHGLKKQQ